MKRTLLFDGGIFAEALQKNNSRTGIFFVAFNVLKQFAASNLFDITILTNPYDTIAVKEFIKKEISPEIKFYFEDYKYLDVYTKAHWNRVKYKKEKRFIKKEYWKIIEKLYKISFRSNKFYDIYFSAHTMFIPGINADKRYLVLHDAIPLIFPYLSKDFENRKGWFFKVADGINDRDNYFTVSQHTKDDYLKLFPQLKPEQITVTPLAASDNFYHETDKNKIGEARHKYNIPDGKKYVFSLCTLEPRKNLIRAVKTFVQFVQKNNIEDLVFVLGGSAWDDFLPKLEEELGKVPDNLIIKAGYVADEDLAALYSGAEWFVYTSQYEGFGLPPLEAMQCGCPVITSNNSSLPEVVGESGIKIDWDSDEQHIASYERYYYDDEFRKQNILEGLKRSKLFSWDKCADIMIKKMTE